MAIGDSVHLIATPDPKNDSNVSALRILDLGNLSETSHQQSPSLLYLPRRVKAGQRAQKVPHQNNAKTNDYPQAHRYTYSVMNMINLHSLVLTSSC